jgi:hypothetical protein
MAAPARDARYLYVYAIVPARAEFSLGVRGIDGETVGLVRCGTLAAVAGEVGEERWFRTPANLLAHQAVVEAVRAAGETLPARFGTVLRGEAAVVAALCERAEQLHEELARLGSMVELDLVILAGSSALREESTERAEPLLSGSNIRGAGAGARYLRGRIRAQAKEQVLEERMHAAKSLIDESLSAYARDVRWMHLATGRIAYIAAYLVHPGSVADFRSAYRRLCGERQEFQFMLREPSAPYSFVS